MTDAEDKYLKGRGAQINTYNRFEKQVLGAFHIEGLDEEAGFSSKQSTYQLILKRLLIKLIVRILAGHTL
jgi:hypothetical protein